MSCRHAVWFSGRCARYHVSLNSRTGNGCGAAVRLSVNLTAAHNEPELKTLVGTCGVDINDSDEAFT